MEAAGTRRGIVALGRTAAFGFKDAEGRAAEDVQEAGGQGERRRSRHEVDEATPMAPGHCRAPRDPEVAEGHASAYP